MFVPLKVAFPDADVPVVEFSVDYWLDPKAHLAVGRALAPLRDQGVLIVGSGMSFHNLGAIGRSSTRAPSEQFDDWLTKVVALDGEARAEHLADWASAPSARFCHPRAEHLLPLMVAAGAAGGPGRRIYTESVLN